MKIKSIKINFMKIVTIIGARPQIIKAAALSRAIKNHHTSPVKEIIVHTGQHYDENMSQVFFDELQIPKPDYNLNVGSASHGIQTAKMIEGIEKILLEEKPDYIVLYGDTNSTLAGAIAASKIHVPIAHVEAGLRSHNKAMPEEINRIVCDHCSTLLFSPTATGFENLLHEGFKANNKGPYTIDNPKIYHCGDIMFDNSLHFSRLSAEKTDIIQKLNLEENGYMLSTIHRDSNTDQTERLQSIFESMIKLSQTTKIVIPLHPRTSKLINNNLNAALQKKLYADKNIILIPPVSFLEMIELERKAKLIMTDSGGVQKESYFFKKPCIILRPETEWTEIVETGAAILVDADKERILKAWDHFNSNKTQEYPAIFGDGNAAKFILEEMIKNLDCGHCN
jgi:UDP-N-acetylglucosamine 2-epimerase